MVIIKILTCISERLALLNRPSARRSFGMFTHRVMRSPR